jgi:ABC-type phosphate transport system permease subunit
MERNLPDEQAKPGCLPMLGILLIEIAVAVPVGFGTYFFLSRLFPGMHGVIAVVLALVAVVPFVWWIDRWGKRKTGASAASYFEPPPI